MTMLANLSIRRKLTLIVAAASAAALLAGGVLLVLSLQWYRVDQRRSLEATAQLVANAGEAAVDFGDADEARLAIGYLRANPDVSAGAFYRGGKVFASYLRSAGIKAVPETVPVAGFNPEDFSVVTPIQNPDGREVGLVYVRTAPEVEDRFLRRIGGMMLIIILLGLAVAIPLIQHFKGIISKPILSLLHTTREVSRNQNFALRARRFADDELGQLVEGFNQMLEQIETRDRQLEKHRDHLEEEVAERTATLREVNEELRTAKEKAEQAQKVANDASQAKSNFLANMSHELRTPLNAIIGYSEMLQEEAKDLGQAHLIPDLQRIHVAGRHLLGLINDILDLSKIEAGKMTLYLEEFEVADLVREVGDTVQPLVAKNGNQFIVDCPADIGRMRADVTKVRQTLFNLLSNASKFTERGTIRLSVDRVLRPPSFVHHSETTGGFWITFVVSDTGIGMTPEQMSRMFTAFSQADTSTARKYGGTGLGLAISRKFCQMMGGEVTVESQHGKGSQFTITLPVAVGGMAGEAAGGATPQAGQTERFQRNTALVLVIDDDATARDLVARCLGKEGYRVMQAADGPSGLELARQLKPNVITLDVMMPGMDGWSVLSALKTDPATASIPVVMLTIVDDRHIGFSLGAADYLTKPIDWPKLLTVIQKYSRPDGPRSALVVEDDAATRQWLRRALEKEGWVVVEAENGRVGLEQLAAGVPGLILLDLMMPEVDGFEFLLSLRQRPGCRLVPVVVMTALDLTEHERGQLNWQAEKILRKSAVDSEELLAELRTLAGRDPGASIDKINQ